jgi:hypothetical protein
VVVVERPGVGKEGEKPIPGFAALAVVKGASAPNLKGFLKAHVCWGTHILTGARPIYRNIEHIALSSLKVFLLGAHHKVELHYPKRYVAEFAYRLNRCTLEVNPFQRLARACLVTNTIGYKDLMNCRIAVKRPGQKPVATLAGPSFSFAHQQIEDDAEGGNGGSA